MSNTTPSYTDEQYQAFMHIYDRFRNKGYLELKKLADKKFNDTEHPRDDVQIGVDVFYDVKEAGHIRCSVALFTVKPQPWWHFWDSAVIAKDFIMAPDGTFVGE